MGKVIGTISGTFRIENIPILQEMMIGVITENGILVNSMPNILEEADKTLLGIFKKEDKNENITKLIKMLAVLKTYDSTKNRK